MRTSQPSSGPSPAAIEPFTKLPPGTWSLRGQKRSVLSPHGYGHLGSAASAAPTTRGSAESARTSAPAAPGIALPLRRAASATMMGSWGHVDVRDQAYKGFDRTTWADTCAHRRVVTTGACLWGVAGVTAVSAGAARLRSHAHAAPHACTPAEAPALAVTTVAPARNTHKKNARSQHRARGQAALAQPCRVFLPCAAKCSSLRTPSASR
jgi:hypothetical protein